MFGFLTIAGLAGIYFLPWYEDPSVYTEAYGIEGIFDILMGVVHWMTAAFAGITLLLIT